MKQKHQRLMYVLVSMAVLSVAVWLILGAMKQQIVYFYTPTEMAKLTPEQLSKTMRLGGLVATGSHQQTNGVHSFAVMDGGADTIAVVFRGSMPALFREGQGVVVEGTWNAPEKRLDATQVLAKHDENYMPPEIAKKLKAQGYWKPQPNTKAPQ